MRSRSDLRGGSIAADPNTQFGVVRPADGDSVQEVNRDVYVIHYHNKRVGSFSSITSNEDPSRGSYPLLIMLQPNFMHTAFGPE